MRQISGLARALPGGRIGWRPQDRVGPVQLAGFRRRAPQQVLLAGFGEKTVARVFGAVREVAAGRVFGDQGPVPRALMFGDLASGGVERENGGSEVAGNPGP